MGFYDPNITFDDYMKKRNLVALTRDEALSKNAIDALLEADLALVHVPTLALSGPHMMEEVTAEWLTKIMGEKVPGAALEDAGINDEHTGMTDRKLLKLRWNEKGVNAGLPSTVFVKATPSSVAHRESLAIFHMSAIEVHFYRKICPELPGIAPTAYYAASYPGGRFLILLQDLNEMGCRPYWIKDDCSIEHARAVVMTLARLHSKFWESERFTSDLAWVRPRTHRFGWSWQHHSFLDSRFKFLNSEQGKSMPEDFRVLLQKWIEHDTTVYRYWEQQESTVLHGDTHLGNTFSYPDGSAGYFDWQVMFRGNGLRDFTNFVLSALTNDQRRQHEVELFDLYLSLLAEGGVKLDKQVAWQDYCLLALESLDGGIKSIVRTTYGHATQGLQRGLECRVGALMDHDVNGLIDCLIRNGSL